MRLHRQYDTAAMILYDDNDTSGKDRSEEDGGTPMRHKKTVFSVTATA